MAVEFVELAILPSLAIVAFACGAERLLQCRAFWLRRQHCRKLRARLLGSERSFSVGSAGDQFDLERAGFSPDTEPASLFDLGLDCLKLRRGQIARGPPVPGGIDECGPLTLQPPASAARSNSRLRHRRMLQ